MSALCECGCGEVPPVATRTRPYLGTVVGEPVRFVVGHQRRQSPHEYREDEATGCWLWQRYVGDSGYGYMWDPTTGKVTVAHRVIYERLVGPIPEGKQLDHVKARGCCHRHCVNPAHLEPVTNAENVQRGCGAKLTPDAVREIRASSQTAALARKFGVDRTMIQHVRSGRAWRNVA